MEPPINSCLDHRGYMDLQSIYGWLLLLNNPSYRYQIQILILTYIDEELALAIAAMEMSLSLDEDDRSSAIEGMLPFILRCSSLQSYY
jgi:hypothetical protein